MSGKGLSETVNELLRQSLVSENKPRSRFSVNPRPMDANSVLHHTDAPHPQTRHVFAVICWRRPEKPKHHFRYNYVGRCLEPNPLVQKVQVLRPHLHRMDDHLVAIIEGENNQLQKPRRNCLTGESSSKSAK